MLPAILQLYSGAQGVNGGRSAGGHLVVGLIVQRLRRVDLGLRRFDAGLIRNRLQVGIADGQHDQIACVFIRILGRFQIFARRARSINRFPVKQRLGDGGACVEI